MRLQTALMSLALAAGLSAQPIVTDIYNFTNTAGDGARPEAGVTVGPGGVLYGTTTTGGSHVYGTVFSLTPPASAGGPWTENVLYAFTSGSDGATPISRLAIGAGPGGAIVLYGTTDFAANTPYGTVFSLTSPASNNAPWTLKTLHTFSGPDGGYPWGGVTLAPNGVLYGAGYYGGTGCTDIYPNNGCGIVYSLKPPTSPAGAWTETILHSFVFTEGFQPQSPIVIGPGGVLYGTAVHGGDFSVCASNKSGCGTAFSLTPPASASGSWTFNVLYSFSDGADGRFPSGVVLGPGGVLYGATYQNVFSLTPPASPGASWTETVLHNYPVDVPILPDLVMGPGGKIFGAIPYGTSSFGSVFSLTPPASAGGLWASQTLFRFSPDNNGNKPQGLTGYLSNGQFTLYGTTEFGLMTLSDNGSVFAVQP